jgi:tetratricopeptide (TPR) repeat protein
MTKVFISYSHDTPEHAKRILDLSDRLREDGLDCFIDQYINGRPEEGWQRWMEKMVRMADFVLVVCTPTYLKRFNGEARDGGRGVNFEGVIISQVLYDNFQQNTRFIPLIPDDGSLDDVPLMLKNGCTYKFGAEYEDFYRVLTDQPRATAKPLGKLKHYYSVNTDNSSLINATIHSDRLPTVKGSFFGRIAELQLLDDAWAGNATRIIQFIAPGGTGKTKLLRHWLNHTIGISNLITWSFHSQSFREDKQASATLFFIHAFEKLGSKYQVSDFVNTDDNKRENKWKEMGEHLAELLRTQCCVLVLDGLEPLQHAGGGMQGELKDSAIRQLLKSLVGQTSGLCIITTRIAVHELSDRQPPAVISHDLQNLDLDDGVLLLQSLGVRGSLPELRKAVREFGCHALALNLLGNMLHLRYQGDVLKRASLRKLPAKFKGSRESRHAFQVMQAYEEWFADEPELALLRLLGLFDHPIGQDVLQVLWDAQIPDLTVGIDEDEWLETVATLRDEHHLLAQNGDGDDLDCHPLIREYFGQQLRDKQPKAWQQAHEALCSYYNSLPEKELPDTLAEMQPLFYAIEHGCHAGLHQQVFEEIYWKRISREKQYYLNKKGFLGDDLAVLIHFFTKPWVKPSTHLDVRTQAHVLQSAGHRLRALGKLAESIKPFTAALKLYQTLGDAKQIAITSSNLIEPQLTLGDVRGAMRNAQRAANSNDLKFIQRLQTFSIFARALHQAGKLPEAHQQFMKAEQIQRLHYPDSPSLHSLSSFRFCELLLEQNRLDEAEERAHYALGIALASAHPLYIGLHKLLIGRLYLLNKHLLEAEQWLSEALDSLQEAGNQDHLPRVYLARAVLHRHTRDFVRAQADLQEVFEIADGSGMRLHLTDYHLESARLLLAEEENPPQSPFCKGGGQEEVGSAVPPFEKGGLGGISLQAHIEAAAKLINETGYHRRDAELAELQAVSV